MTQESFIRFGGEDYLDNTYPVELVTPHGPREIIDSLYRHEGDLLTAGFVDQLLIDFSHVDTYEIHRLGLLIYGIRLPDDFIHRPRREGVVSGVDLYVANDKPSEDEAVDWHSGRLALFEADSKSSPYFLDHTSLRIMFWDRDIGMC